MFEAQTKHPEEVRRTNNQQVLRGSLSLYLQGAKCCASLVLPVCALLSAAHLSLFSSPYLF